MRVLGLDLSKSRTGYAMDGRDGVCPPRVGSWRPRGGGLGRLGLDWQEWLYEYARTNEVELLAYEAPVLAGSGIVMNVETSMALIGLAFSVEIIATSLGIRAAPVHVQSARRLFVGHGRPKQPKQVVMERCRQLGWPAPNTDATDAVAVWVWAKTNFDSSFRLEAATPLFARTA